MAAGFLRDGIEVLTPAEMETADRFAIATGVPGAILMERAGRWVADAARRMWRGGPIAVLAGPGNNGGDGFVAARVLRDVGFHVTVLLYGDPGRLKGDAAEAAQRFDGVISPAEPGELRKAGLVIDALFGAGFRLPLSAAAAALVRAVNAADATVLAVDVPSGVDGASGAIDGVAIEASATVTFHRLKPGHLLLPGRLHCGPVEVTDIGIPGGALAALGARTFVNRPELWRHAFPVLSADTHKYRRGHAVIVSGPASATGAGRLAARTALRIGAGLVTVATPPSALLVNAAHVTAVMVRAFDGPNGLSELLGDKRVTAAVIGPGVSAAEDVIPLVEAAMASPAAVVLDAGALSAFAKGPGRLVSLLSRHSAPAVLTPHDGEFARIFPDITGSRLDRARAAAERSGAIVISKGPDTVVASPDGRAAIADNAPPTLATAGTGDTLAGLVAGLVAQGMPPFEAAAAAVYIHGEAARAFGPGLIAEDLAEMVPAVLRELAL